MKKIAGSILLVFMTCVVAHAEWLVDFKNNYANDGIEIAVEGAMKEGANPDMIVENGLKFNDLNPQNLVKALFCAGAKGQDIRDAAEKWQLSELVVAAGYKKSVAECGDQIVDTQAYTELAGPSFARPTLGSSGGTTVSPSTPGI